MVSLTSLVLISTALTAASEVSLPPVVDKPECVVAYPNDLPLSTWMISPTGDVEIVSGRQMYAETYRRGWDACWERFQVSQSVQRPFHGNDLTFSSDLDVPFGQAGILQLGGPIIGDGESGYFEGYGRCADALKLEVTRPGSRSRTLTFQRTEAEAMTSFTDWIELVR